MARHLHGDLVAGVKRDLEPDRAGTAEMLERMTGLASSQLPDAAVAFSARDLVLAPRRRSRGRRDRSPGNRDIFAATLELEVADQRERALRHVLIARCPGIGAACRAWGNAPAGA